jgi:hypothetical protein
MIGVGVGQDDGGDVSRDVTERGEVCVEPRAETRNAGVDGGQPASLLDEVPVDLS